MFSLVRRLYKLTWLLYTLRVQQTENILASTLKYGKKTLILYFTLTLILAILPLSSILFHIIISDKDALFSIIFLTFTSIFTIYQLRPILGIGFGLGFDISKLLHYPVDIKNIIYAGVLGNFLDALTLLIIPPLFAILAALYLSCGFAYALLFLFCTLIFLIHSFSFSQLISISFQICSSNRSYKDALSALGILLLIIFVCITQIIPSFFVNYENFSPNIYPLIWFFPPAYISNILEGNNPIIFIILLILSAYLPIPITISIAERKFYEPIHRRYNINMKTQNSKISKINPLLSPKKQDFHAIFSKEWAYLIRDPSRKMVFLSPVLISFVLLINTSYVELPEMMIYMLAMGIPWSIVPQIGQNSLGLEGKSIWLLLSTPCKRENIFIAKNTVIFIVGSTISFLVLFIFCAYFSTFVHFLSSFLFSFCSILIFAGLGNFLSVYFPMKVESHTTKRKQISPQSAMIYMFAGLGLITPPLLLITVPLMASKLAEYELIPQTFYNLGYIQIIYLMLIPSFAYSLFLYKKMLKSAVKKMNALEPELTDICS